MLHNHHLSRSTKILEYLCLVPSLTLGPRTSLRDAFLQQALGGLPQIACGRLIKKACGKSCWRKRRTGKLKVGRGWAQRMSALQLSPGLTPHENPIHVASFPCCSGLRMTSTHSAVTSIRCTTFGVGDVHVRPLKQVATLAPFAQLVPNLSAAG